MHMKIISTCPACQYCKNLDRKSGVLLNCHTVFSRLLTGEDRYIQTMVAHYHSMDLERDLDLDLFRDSDLDLDLDRDLDWDRDFERE